MAYDIILPEGLFRFLRQENLLTDYLQGKNPLKCLRSMIHRLRFCPYIKIAMQRFEYKDGIEYFHVSQLDTV